MFGREGERFPRVVLALRELLFREVVSDPTIPGVIFTFVWAFNVPEDRQLASAFAAKSITR